MKPYTVILMRPDYVAADWPYDCYVASVEGNTPAEATRAARTKLAKVDRKEKNPVNDKNDYAVLYVFEGHLPRPVVWPWDGA